jgi:CRISPR type IV-associated protein Csf3
MLDGLIAHVMFEALLGPMWNLIPLREPMPLLEWYPLPFEKNDFNTNTIPDFFYKASCSRFERQETYGTTLHKLIATEDFEYLEKPKKTYDRVRGEFKAYAMEMRCNPSHYVDFYCMGDKEHILKWCKMILGLGKKRAVGFGKIMGVEILSVEKDLSIDLNQEFNRPIPVGYNPNLTNPKALLAYKPPYWAKLNHKICYIPGGFA